MSTNVLPPNPCLVAIMLVVSTKIEPRIVFHYPPKPGEDNSSFRNIFKDGSTDDTSSSSEDGGGSSADEIPITEKPNEESQGRGSPPEAEETGSVSPKKAVGLLSDQSKLRWNDIFGYQSSVMAKLLSPPSLYHKKRFEMSLSDNVFLGWPVHAKANGSWRNTKKMRRSSSKSNLPEGSAPSVQEDLRMSSLKAAATNDPQASETSGHESGTDRLDDPKTKVSVEAVPMQTDTENTGDEGKTGARDTVAALGTRAKNQITMFHVVFVLSPPPMEYDLRIREMYDNVVKKFSKALKWEQTRSNYVAKETSMIWSTTKRVNRSSGNAVLLRFYSTKLTVFRRKATSGNPLS